MSLNYFCPKCNTIFETPAQYHYGGEGSLPPVILEECPHCGSEYFVPAKQCDNCHDFILGKYVETVYGDILCEDCYVEHDISDGVTT